MPPTPLTSRQAFLYISKLISLGLPAIWLRSPAQTFQYTPQGPKDIPPDRRGKAPIAEGWSSQDALTIEELHRQWGEGEPGYNIGIRTGRVNGAQLNIIAVDLDSAEALKWAEENLPPTEIRTRTSKGQHWIYRAPRTRIGNRAHIGDMTIDLRADGGQIVSPGSVHGTGFTYSAVVPWTLERLADMPLFDPQWFGKEAKWDGAEDVVLAEGGERRDPIFVPMERKRKRALAYLAHAPGTVPGQGKGAGAECLYYARALVFGLCIPPDAAAQIMVQSEWNQRCTTSQGDPYPWTLDELRHKCENAYRLAFEKPYGFLLLEDQEEQKAAAALKTHEILEGIAKEIQDIEAAATWWDFQVDEQEVLEPGKQRWPLTDTGNAERLVARFGESIRWVEDRKTWMVWDGKTGRWVDRRVCLDRCSKVTARRIGEEIPSAEEAEAIARTNFLQKEGGLKADVDIAKDALKQAEKNLHKIRAFQSYSESASGRSAMISLSSSEPNIAVSTSIFDQRHMMLNVRNGVLDLGSGKMRPHNRDFYFTKVCQVEYDENAECPTWERCLAQWMEEDEEMIKFLQRIAGYCLTGVTREQCMFIFVGEGANGKSTFLNALRTILGPYTSTASAGLLMETRQDKASPSQLAGLAALLGSRLVIATETDESGHLSEPQVKMVVGDSYDRITAKWMGENFFEYTPTHKVVLQTNYKPSITGTDEGIWRRLHLIDWPTHIADDRRDTGLAAKLMAERKGILSWAVRGCVDWQQNRLNPPQKVLDAVKTYRKEQDTIGNFFEDHIDFKDGLFVSKSTLREAYEFWCESLGHVPFKGKRFNTEIIKRATKLGVKVDPEARTNAARGWGGLGLKS